jgi:hypothetical protein
LTQKLAILEQELRETRGHLNIDKPEKSLGEPTAEAQRAIGGR